MSIRMQQRRGTAEQWTNLNPTLAAGEIGFETDTYKFKIGDGVNNWASLEYFSAGGVGGALSDYYTSTETDQAITTAVSGIIDSAPELLNTLNEISAAIGDDEDFITTITNQITGGDSSTLSSAQSYSDSGDTSTLNAAKNYADGLASNYDAAGSAATAETDANTYTDNAVEDLASESYVDTKDSETLAAANTYTDIRIANVGGGGEGTKSGFQIFTGDSGDTTFELLDEQPEGNYWITSRLSEDYVYDIYVASATGGFSGYTTNRQLSATDPIKYIVIYGASPNDILDFDFKPVATSTPAGNIDGGVAPFATSVSVTDLVDVGDSTVVTGGNFSDNVSVVFTGSDLVARDAKTVVKNSTTQITVTRPDVLPPEYSPYSLSFVNPGIPAPTNGSNVINDIISSGGYPIWNTGQDLLWTLGNTSSLTLSAGDPDSSEITYSVVSGSLFSGFSLDQTTGVISGDDSALSEGQSAIFTVRAEDAGGNSTTRQFTILINQVVQWVTPAGFIGEVNTLAGNNIQLEHDDGGVGSSVVYTLEAGALPQGMDLSPSGQITGQAQEEGTFTFTIGIADEGGVLNTREFSVSSIAQVFSWYFDPFSTVSKSPKIFLGDYSL